MTESSISRREFTAGTLQSLLTLAFLETLSVGDAFGAEIKPIAAQWLKDLDELGHDVKGEKISQLVWQKKVEELFSKVELPKLLKFLDFEKLTANLEFRDHGERSLRPVFPEGGRLTDGVGFRASGVCVTERTIGCSPRSRQHVYRVSDPGRRISRPIVRPPGR